MSLIKLKLKTAWLFAKLDRIINASFVFRVTVRPGENMDNTSTEPTTMDVNGTSNAADHAELIETQTIR